MGSNKLVRLAIALLLGGFAAQHSRVLINWDHCLLLFVASAALLPNRRLWILSAFFTGFAFFSVVAKIELENRLDERFAGDSMLVTARVVSFPSVDADMTSMRIAPVADTRLPRIVRVSWFEAPITPANGDTWQLELKLRRPRGVANPGGFDVERWMFRERIYASGYVVQGKRNRLIRSGDLNGITRFRVRIIETLRVVPEFQGVLAAIAVGARHQISNEQWDRYAASGTSHLMAISGLHIGLAAMVSAAIVYVFSVLLGSRGNHLRRAALGGVVLAVFYAWVSGFGVPAQRATLMILLAAIAVVAARQVRLSYVLIVVALVIYLVNPLSIMAPGFLLSFAAVAVLRCSGLAIQVNRSRTSRLRQLWTAQLWLLFGLMPLTAILFGRVALVAPFVNFVAVPLFSVLVVPAMLAGMLVLAFDQMFAELLFRLANFGLTTVEWIIDLATSVAVTDINLEQQMGIEKSILLLPLIWLLLPRGWPGRLIAPLALLCVVTHEASSPHTGCADVHVLDVGQGQAVVVRTAGHTLLYDTGPAYRSGGTAAENIIIPFLQYVGIQRVDWLIVSHADLDHAGGVQSILQEIDVGEVLAGEPLDIPEFHERACLDGQHWQADGLTFSVLHPGESYQHTGNDQSCVIEVAIGNYRLLLTGDIESDGEHRLLDRGVSPKYELVTVPHHGSLTSSEPAFVNHVRARIAVASTGYGNRWGFPNNRVQARWRGAGSLFLDTGTSGAISVSVCRWRGIRKVIEHRRERSRFWHDDATYQ